MMSPVRTAVAVGLPLLLTAGVVTAGPTLSFRQTTAKDFEEGEATASVILPSGEVGPGMKANRVAVEAAFVWSSALSADGKTAYFGTGVEGRIFAITLRQGNTAPIPRKLADLDVPWVTSLMVLPDGSLLAGSTPGGRIFQIDPVKGEVRTFAKLPADHVWTLARDSGSGTIYAGTGGPGKVFALDAKGAARQLWDSGDKQVVSLLPVGGGALLVGTSDSGILYRVYADGRAEAAHDFEAEEVRAILRVGNVTYVAVNDFAGQSDSAPAVGSGASTLAAARGTRISLAGGAAPAAVGAGVVPGSTKAQGAVYRLTDAGALEQVFAISDGYLSALLADPGGDVYAAAGAQGKVYRLLPDRTFALAADLSERQALTLVRAGDGFLVGTGDVGGVYEVRPAAPGEASYLSKVFDGEFFTTWGRLRWTGSTGLLFETRSGNTAKPDKSWTAWKKLEGVGSEAGEGEGKVSSPASRYLQYKVTFPAKATTLGEVSVFYLPQNQRPRVTDIYLAESGTGGSASTGSGSGGGGAAATSTSTSTSSATRAHSPTLKLRWKVENPDGDALLYRLYYRQERESVWRPLGGEDPLTKSELDWNTDSVPDGKYLVRVWVTDERSNASDRALDSVFVSAPFLVDNTRPEVQMQGRPPAVTGRARDATSLVSHIEFSVDGEDWRPATPSDGLFDQRTEGFAIRLPEGLSRGPHVVNVRVWDAADNLGAARIQVDSR